MHSRFLALILGALLLAGVAPATIISSWDLTPYTGQDIGVNVVVEDIGGDVLQITASVVPYGANNIGDLRGLFFNMDPNTGVEADMFDGADLTEVCFGPDLDSCGGGGNNINPLSEIPDVPAGSFHVGFEIGTSGLTPDDIQTTVILFDYAAFGSMPVLGPFAARVMSVGVIGGPREGSSKLYAGEPDPDTPGDEGDPIPEPSTWLLMGGGLLALGMARRYRKA